MALADLVAVLRTDLSDPQALHKTMGTLINSHFDRKPMADYEYLRGEINTPGWIHVVAIVVMALAILISGMGPIWFCPRRGVFYHQYYGRR